MKVFNKMWKKMKDKKGFTLIEMIIVIAIIAILIALIAPNVIKYMQTAKETKISGAAKTLYTSANAYMAELALKGDSMPDSANEEVKPTDDTPSQRFGKKFCDAYFNSEEIKDATMKVTVKDGVVVKATWTQNGITASYPID